MLSNFSCSLKSQQVGSAIDLYHLNISLVTFIYTQLGTHLAPENGKILKKYLQKCDHSYKKGPLYLKKNKLGPFFLVGQNVVLMRTLVLHEDLIGSTE